MPRPDKAVEPSMEEILASIRKIISEEPIGTRPGPSDGQAPADALGRYEPGADPSLAGPRLPPAPRRPQSSDTVGIDEMLDLAQATAPGQSTGDKGWSLARPVGAEPRLQAPAPNDATTAAAAEPTRDGLPEGTKSIFPPLQRELNGHRGTSEPGAAAASRPSDDAARRARPSVDADAALSQARAKIERHLGKPAAAEAPDRPAMLGLKSIRDADFRGGRQEAAGRSGAGGLMQRVAAAGGHPEPSANDEAAASERAGAAGGPNGIADPAPEAKGATQKAAESPVVPKADAPKAPVPDAAISNAASAEKNHAAPAQGDGKPLQSAPAATGTTAPPPGERARAFEDAVAEMLRPMLREWLDANLPRLVQQALREEMTKSRLPGKDSPTG